MAMRFLAGFLLATCCAAHALAAPAPAANLSETQRIQILERRVNTLSQLALRLDVVEQENRQLRGEIETLQHRIQQMQRKQRDIYADIDQRLSNRVDNQPPPQVTPTATSQPSQNTPTPAADPEQARAEYDAAYALLNPAKRQYPQAIKAFKAFIEKYPQNKLAANAQYWLAETYYVTQDNQAALAAFKKVTEIYPDSTKVPGAWYKIGRIEEANSRWQPAAIAYRTVTEKYPQSSAAGLAKKALAGLQAKKQ
jgi:tol-pal system protein YbgF